MVDPPTVGLWCGRCASHSAWEALYAITPRIDPTFTVWRGWFRRCNTCLGYITSAYPTA